MVVVVVFGCLVVSNSLDPMDCSLPALLFMGFPKQEKLEWVATSFSRGSSWPRDWARVSWTAGKFFAIWATRETPTYKDAFRNICIHIWVIHPQTQNLLSHEWASLVALVVKHLPDYAGGTRDAGSIPELGRDPEVGDGNPLQYSCLGSLMDSRAWWATVHGVTKSWIQLSNWPHK